MGSWKAIDKNAISWSAYLEKLSNLYFEDINHNLFLQEIFTL